MIFPRSKFLPAIALALSSTFVFAQEATPLKATPVMADETRLMVQLLENVHFKHEDITAEDFKKLLPDFMRELDVQRMLFVGSDEAQLLSRFGPRLSSDLHYRGNLDAAFAVFSLYQQRVAERVAWVQKRLEGDFDFTVSESYMFDREKAEWPVDNEAADVLWVRRLKYELLQDLLNKKTLDVAKETVRKRYERMLRNIQEITAEELQEIYLTTLAKMYDPHTSYMAPTSLDDFQTQMRLSLQGIGAQLAEEDGVCVVREVMPGSPAELEGSLAPGDKIVAVAQGAADPVDVTGLRLKKVVQQIRGEKGTTVRLIVNPSDASDSSVRKEISIVRDVVKLNASRAHAQIFDIPKEDGATIPIGVITIPSFYGAPPDGESTEPVSVSADVAKLLNKLAEANVQGIVIDLRRNGGGLLHEAIQLTGLFIEKGPVVQVKQGDGRVVAQSDMDPSITYNGPLTVLTSRFSASASEIFAGALQNYGRAIIVGGKSTHGKGTVQSIYEIANLLQQRTFISARPKTGALRLTIQKYYLPDGSSTQLRGVVPDVTQPTIEDCFPIGESSLPNALPWDTVPSASFKGTPMSKEFLAALQEQSEKRRAASAEFALLGKSIDWYKEREARKEISLQIDERRAQKKRDDTLRKEMKAERAELAKNNFPVREVLVDGVPPREKPKKTKRKSAPKVEPEIEKAGEEKSESATDVTPPSAESEKTPENAIAENEVEDETDEEDLEEILDIHLREALRIVCDSISISEKAEKTAQNSIALKSVEASKALQ